MTPDQPHSAGDTPLSEVVETIDHALGEPDRRGGQFAARSGARIACLTCGNEFGADEVSADAVTRLEGASDPGDMSMVVPVVCPSCGTDGSLVLRYGPEAGEADTDVLLAMDRRPTVDGGDEPTPGIRS